MEIQTSSRQFVHFLHNLAPGRLRELLTFYAHGNYSQAQIWSYAEGCIAFFAACLPAGRVLLARKRLRRQIMNKPNTIELKSHSTKSNGPVYLQADEDYSLVVFKVTSLGAESTIKLTGGE